MWLFLLHVIVLNGLSSEANVPKGQLPEAVREVFVLNRAQLDAAINAAQPGDHIILADGIYGGGDFTIPQTINGTSGHPIVIRSENMHQAVIRFGSQIAGSHITVWGMVFDGVSVRVFGDHVSFLRNIFENMMSSGAIQIRIDGKDIDLGYNLIRNSRGRGISIGVAAGGRRVRIFRNHFLDFDNNPVNATEPIQVGFGRADMFVSAECIIEYNIFENTVNDNEIISVKSSDNIIRFNTVIDSPGAAFVNRMGNRNLYLANWLENCIGMRGGYADNDYVGNIGVATSSGILIQGGMMNPYDDPPDNVTRGAAWNNRLIANSFPDGTTVIGHDFSDNSFVEPARDIMIEGHVGEVNVRDILPATGGPATINTIIRETVLTQDFDPIPVAVRLQSHEVGPFADLPDFDLIISENLSAQANAGIYANVEQANARGDLYLGHVDASAGEKRVLVRFDSATLPDFAEIVELELGLTILHAIGVSAENPLQIRVHRLNAPWTEGNARATGTAGATPGDGDVTWFHRTFPNIYWNSSGSDFDPTPSAEFALDSDPVVGSRLVLSGSGMFSDLQAWRRDPATNHGWLILVKDAPTGVGLRLANRHGRQPHLGPSLKVDYRLLEPLSWGNISAINAMGDAYDARFLGSINVLNAPWIWSRATNSWLFIPVEPSDLDNGFWIFYPRSPSD